MANAILIGCVTIGLLAILGGTLSVYFIVFHHRGRHWHIDAGVTSASLARFDLDRDSGTLQYNLALDISLGNPNRDSTVWYKKLGARALYGGEEIGGVELEPFIQKPKTSTTVSPLFQGQVRVSGASIVGQFLQEKEKGAFSIEVELHAQINATWTGDSNGKSYNAAAESYSPEVGCALKLPLTPNGGSSARFSRADCDIKF